MLTHKHVWLAIDALATRNGMTVSALARCAGLDSTTFNKSKRITSSGKKRWPNTESISKILAATNAGLDEFLGLINHAGDEVTGAFAGIPLIGFAEAGAGGFFDDGGFPVGGSWEQVHISELKDDNLYALKISGDSMLPLFRDGDTIIVSPNTSVRRGDRVVVKTDTGEVMAKILYRKSARTIELHSLNPEHENRSFPIENISWIARILWASQ